MRDNICIVVTKYKGSHLIISRFLLRFLKCSWRQTKLALFKYPNYFTFAYVCFRLHHLSISLIKVSTLHRIDKVVVQGKVAFQWSKG